MSNECQGKTKSGKDCRYKGRFEKEGKHFCKTHLPIEDCSVCYEPILKRNGTALSCGHVFHTQCLRKWVTRDRSTCPYCREQIAEDVLDRLCPPPIEDVRTFVIDFQEHSNESGDLQRFIMSLLNLHVLSLITNAQIDRQAPSLSTEQANFINP